MIRPSETCWCWCCDEHIRLMANPNERMVQRNNACPICDKQDCPRASSHYQPCVPADLRASTR